jgi:hypothetical protein
MRGLQVSILVACLALLSPMAHAQTAPGGEAGYIARFCADHGDTARHAKFVEWLVGRLALTDAQKVSFNDFEDARAKSLFDSKASLCTSTPDLSSFEARLIFGQNFLEARLNALKAENPKLIAFYKSLDDRQKKIFDEIREHARVGPR